MGIKPPNLRNLGAHGAFPLPVSSQHAAGAAHPEPAALAQLSPVKDEAQALLAANTDPAVVLLRVAAPAFPSHFQKLVLQFPKSKIKQIQVLIWRFNSMIYKNLLTD